ncbi:MAG: ATP synthase subunit C [Promethearchaeota archaeon]|jgi:V/A-type H+-transporting ATPase subunit K
MNGKQKFYVSLAIIQVLLVILLISSLNGLVRFVGAQADNFDYYNSPTTAILAISAALAISISGLAAAYVIRTVGTAAISALSEREEAFGKLVVIVALGEAIAIYGLIIAILLVFQIPSPPGA